jgi:hypothetical protein
MDSLHYVVFVLKRSFRTVWCGTEKTEIYFFLLQNLRVFHYLDRIRIQGFCLNFENHKYLYGTYLSMNYWTLPIPRCFFIQFLVWCTGYMVCYRSGFLNTESYIILFYSVADSGCLSRNRILIFSNSCCLLNQNTAYLVTADHNCHHFSFYFSGCKLLNIHML